MYIVLYNTIFFGKILIEVCSPRLYASIWYPLCLNWSENFSQKVKIYLFPCRSSFPGDLIKDPSFKETLNITFSFRKEAFPTTNLLQNIFVSNNSLRYINSITMGQIFASFRLQNFHSLFQNGR